MNYENNKRQRTVTAIDDAYLKYTYHAEDDSVRRTSAEREYFVSSKNWHSQLYSVHVL